MRAILIAAVLAATTTLAHATPADTLLKLSGMHERSNRAALKRVLSIDPVRVPWCGAAVAWAVKKANRKPPAAPLKAISWKRYGKAVTLSSARRGDVFVVRTKRGHHVSIVTARKGNRLCGVGGNQGNSVRVSCYRTSSVVAVRR